VFELAFIGVVLLRVNLINLTTDLYAIGINANLIARDFSDIAFF